MVRFNPRPPQPGERVIRVHTIRDLLRGGGVQKVIGTLHEVRGRKIVRSPELRLGFVLLDERFTVTRRTEAVVPGKALLKTEAERLERKAAALRQRVKELR
jgi:hypothetical protein